MSSGGYRAGGRDCGALQLRRGKFEDHTSAVCPGPGSLTAGRPACLHFPLRRPSAARGRAGPSAWLVGPGRFRRGHCLIHVSRPPQKCHTSAQRQARSYLVVLGLRGQGREWQSGVRPGLGRELYFGVRWAACRQVRYWVVPAIWRTSGQQLLTVQQGSRRSPIGPRSSPARSLTSVPRSLAVASGRSIDRNEFLNRCDVNSVDGADPVDRLWVVGGAPWRGVADE